ncbi:hypothetical protein AALM74_14970, partial [Parabacteroides segnis]|uniref:hypothetical protein n=2 Tax=Parabacteroides TaxID=375288 RepID=UPI00351730CF
RTEKLSPTTSMVLRKSGRVDSRRFRVTDSKQMKGINRKVGSFLHLDKSFIFVQKSMLYDQVLYLICFLFYLR